MRETVPDSVFEQADEVELIDLPPDELLERFKDGKVYMPEQAQEAVQHFFRKGNLIALRELALRRTAERVDAQMRVYMHEHAIEKAWPTAERLLVCISPGPESARLVRAGKRMADRLGAPWVAAYVETPAQLRLPAEVRDRVTQTLRLAEQLGAETVRLPGEKMSEAILAFAHDRNVTKIVVGKPRRRLWTRILIGSIVDALVQGSGDIDVYVISAEREQQIVPPAPLGRRAIPSDWAPYGWAMAVVALATGAAWLTLPFFELANLVMVYLLGIVVVATRYGRGPSLMASILSVAALDFFFVAPVFTFAVSDVRYLFTFVVMLVVGLVTSGLAARIRLQADAARQRERRTAALYAMSRELASTRGLDELLTIAVRHISEVFRSQIVVLLPGPDGGSLASWAGGQLRSIRTSSAWRSGCTSTTSRRGSARPPCPAPPRSICPCRRRAAPSESSACGPPISTRSIHPISCTSSRRSPIRRRWRASARIWPTRRSRPRCASRPSACATRCSARSRTTSGRRWPPSRARPRR